MKPLLSRTAAKLTGDTSKLTGDMTGLSGNVTGLSGNVDECEITDDERKAGIDIERLIGEKEKVKS